MSATAAIEALRDFIAAHESIFVLTGAGVSTDSGIPDYRDADGQWKRQPPVTLQAFMGDDAVRRRYWARSMLGWNFFVTAQPNAAARSNCCSRKTWTACTSAPAARA